MPDRGPWPAKFGLRSGKFQILFWRLHQFTKAPSALLVFVCADSYLRGLRSEYRLVLEFGKRWCSLWSDFSIDLKNLRHISLRLSLSVGSCEQTKASPYDDPGKIMRIARICTLSISSVRYWVRPGCHAAHAYSSTGRILVVYMSNISFEGIPSRRHSTNKCSRCEALPVMYSTCWFHLRSSLIITPRFRYWNAFLVWNVPQGYCSIQLFKLRRHFLFSFLST